ncbi:hypothetical protein [Polyangium sp. 15x6]|uniref:hypothetical protein n=1 Tax=Polyangium sp. 15x6 TaxID=3042687 RepID=UPI00249BD1E1|nr:hypothetical protein [Polyangium sp. 15x6]MDI3286595.1 hypothetical protein [Polyangium sp. 15x6]
MKARIPALVAILCFTSCGREPAPHGSSGPTNPPSTPSAPAPRPEGDEADEASSAAREALRILELATPSREAFADFYDTLRKCPRSATRTRILVDAGRILASWPDAMRFRVADKNLEPPEDLELWGLVRHLELHLFFRKGDSTPDFDKPHLTQLTGLQLSAFRLDDGGTGPVIASLAAAPSLAGLRELRIETSEIGDDGARAIAASTTLRKLRVLEIVHDEITSAGARALFTSDNLRNVETLSLHDNRIGVDGAEALASSTTLAHLQSLDLSNNHIHAEGAAAIAASTSLRRLESLDLGFNFIGPEGALAIAASTNLPRLRVLVLSFNHAGDDGAISIATRKEPWPLTSLELAYNGITDRGAIALAHSNALPKALALGLLYNPTGDTGEQALGKARPTAILGRDPTADGSYTGEYSFLPPRGAPRLRLPHVPARGLPRTVEFRRDLNVRFAFGVDHPTFMLPESRPANGDGRRFRWEDRATLTAAGGHLLDTFDEQLARDSLADEGATVLVKQKSKDMHLLELSTPRRVTHRRSELRDGRIVTVDFAYDRSLDAYFRPIAARIMSSIRVLPYP